MGVIVAIGTIVVVLFLLTVFSVQQAIASGIPVAVSQIPSLLYDMTVFALVVGLSSCIPQLDDGFFSLSAGPLGCGVFLLFLLPFIGATLYILAWTSWQAWRRLGTQSGTR